MKENLLLLHGALGSKVQLDLLKEELSRNFKVYTLDFVGHGAVLSDEEFSLSLFTDNVVNFLNEKKIKNCHLFGYSMGGYVALNVALKKPDLVGKIVTFGTKFNWTEASAKAEVKMLNPQKIEEKVPAFAKKLAMVHVRNNWKSVVLKTARLMMDLAGGDKLTTGQLESIFNYTLIGVGDEDQMVTIKESRESAAALPNGKLEILQGVKHPIEKVSAKLLHTVISNFISKVTFKVVKYGSSEWKEAVALREKVLRQPLGQSFTEDELEAERKQFHIVGVLGHQIVATGVLVPEKKVVKMQRVVVLEAFRNKGTGSEMMLFCESFASEKGFRELYCHARSQAVNFYLKNNYQSIGAYFDEDGIPHLKMEKVLAVDT